jgi:hypothetical protein
VAPQRRARGVYSNHATGRLRQCSTTCQGNITGLSGFLDLQPVPTRPGSVRRGRPFRHDAIEAAVDCRICNSMGSHIRTAVLRKVVLAIRGKSQHDFFDVAHGSDQVGIPRQSRGLYDVSRSKRLFGVADAAPVLMGHLKVAGQIDRVRRQTPRRIRLLMRSTPGVGLAVYPK